MRVGCGRRRGFGATVIDKALEETLRGKARMHWLESGLVCEIELPRS